MITSWQESYDKPRQCIKKQRHHLPTNVCIVKVFVFPVVMYRCESWTIKRAEHWRIDAFEVRDWRRFESPLDSKEIKPVNPKGNHPWILTGWTDAEAEAQILWPPDVKSRLTRKDPDARENRRQNEKKVTGDEMIEWYHWFNGHELVQPLRDGEGQGGLACCSPWGLNWTQLGDWTTAMRYEVENVLICHLYLYFGEMSVQTASCFKIGLFCNDLHGNRIFKKSEYNWLTLLYRRN